MALFANCEKVKIFIKNLGFKASALSKTSLPKMIFAQIRSFISLGVWDERYFVARCKTPKSAVDSADCVDFFAESALFLLDSAILYPNPPPHLQKCYLSNF